MCASHIFNKRKHVLAKALLPKAALLDWSAPGLTVKFMEIFFFLVKKWSYLVSAPDPSICINCVSVVSAINTVTLLGRAGGEAQKRGTDEHPVVIFSLATHTNYKYDTGNVKL